MAEQVKPESSPTAAPFILEGSKLKVSKGFMEEHREHLQGLADKHGYGSPEEYLVAVAANKIKPFGKKKYTGTTIADTDKLTWSPEDKDKARDIASRHGMKPEEFMAIVSHESAGTMNPQVVNKIGATGLIQFVPSTAAELLLKEQRAAAISAATTPEAVKAAKKNNKLYGELTEAQQNAAMTWAQKSIANLPVSRQLDLADLYISANAAGKKGMDNVYTAIFAGNPNQQTFKKGTKFYNNNESLDLNSDGVLTREEWMSRVRSKVGVEESPKETSKKVAKATPVSTVVTPPPSVSQAVREYSSPDSLDSEQDNTPDRKGGGAGRNYELRAKQILALNSDVFPSVASPEVETAWGSAPTNEVASLEPSTTPEIGDELPDFLISAFQRSKIG